MYISKDFSYINANETMLMDNGYGKLSVHSIHFDRHYSEEQKEKNREIAESMTREEWSKHCDEIAEGFAKSLNEILEKFLSKYCIYQASENVSYDSDWDLFFWSDRGWNGKDFMTYFKLNFNKERSPEQNMTLLDEIISLVETMEYENIGCRIQYDAVIDNEDSTEWAIYQNVLKDNGKYESVEYDELMEFTGNANNILPDFQIYYIRALQLLADR